MNVTQKDAPYAAAWDEYRRRWRTIYCLLGGTIAWGLFCMVLPRAFDGISFVVLPFMLTGMFFYWRLQFWPCPRCKQWFFFSQEEANSNGILFLSWRCRHCRLPKWAVRDPE